MKKALSILAAALAVCVAPAQKDDTNPFLPIQVPFKMAGVQYHARIERSAVLSSPQWNPTKSLPVRLDEVERVARRELRKLVQDEALWNVDEFTIKRVAGTEHWYYLVGLSESPRTTNSDYATAFFVDFDGKPGVTDPATK